MQSCLQFEVWCRCEREEFYITLVNVDGRGQSLSEGTKGRVEHLGEAVFLLS